MADRNGAGLPAGNGNGLPAGIGRPATQALTLAGYTRLDQLTQATERDLLELHGVGPKAVRILRERLGEQGLAFRNP